jgi:hypothetical protein
MHGLCAHVALQPFGPATALAAAVHLVDLPRLGDVTSPHMTSLLIVILIRLLSEPPSPLPSQMLTTFFFSTDPLPLPAEEVCSYPAISLCCISDGMTLQILLESLEERILELRHSCVQVNLALLMSKFSEVTGSSQKYCWTCGKEVQIHIT